MLCPDPVVDHMAEEALAEAEALEAEARAVEALEAAREAAVLEEVAFTAVRTVHPQEAHAAFGEAVGTDAPITAAVALAACSVC